LKSQNNNLNELAGLYGTYGADELRFVLSQNGKWLLGSLDSKGETKYTSKGNWTYTHGGIMCKDDFGFLGFMVEVKPGGLSIAGGNLLKKV